jgi:hypothetical protein
MTRDRWAGSTGIVLLVVFAAQVAAAAPAAPQAAAAAAVKASPALIGALSKELGATPEQAAGAAGSLFGVAQSRLKPEQFSQVAAAVPGMADLLRAAPSGGSGKSPVGTSGLSGLSSLSGVAGGAGGLASAAAAFSQLGLKPDMVAKAIPVLMSFVSKSGGSGVASLLAGALK